MAAALLAATLVAMARLFGWGGVDLAAQVHRVDAFRTTGFSLWDPQWYGGHWTLDYSIGYPALAATLGIGPVAVASAALAALAFDRLVRPALGEGALAASLVFAAGTLVQASIGQMPFLLGEALGLAALWSACRRHWAPAWGLALLATLASPLAGAFVALAAAAWMVGTWRDDNDGDRRARLGRMALIAGAALLPLAVTAVLFPGQGPMPYPVTDWLWEMVVAMGIAALSWPRHKVIAAGASLLAAAMVLALALPSPLGGNIGRIEDIVALPLATGLLWTRRYLLMVLAGIPLALSQWVPAWGALTETATLPSTKAAYFAPLATELRALGAPGSGVRLEVVPLAYHWESAYVASVMPLARGWERQLDVADNPLFYGRSPLNGASYRAWLADNGVGFVAVADGPLDPAGTAEAVLLAARVVPGVEPVWSSSHWRLYEVRSGQGIVGGPARLVSASGSSLVVEAVAPGTVTVRVRYNRSWVISSGVGCLAPAPGSWVLVEVPQPETFTLALSLVGRHDDSCRQGAGRGA